MKKLFILTAIIAASLITTKGYSQVIIGARVGFGHVRVGFPVIAPAPVFVAPAPVVVAAPAPVVIDPVICADFPGYAYYNYPAWNGHFRDRVYFEHYRPFFVHAHPAFRAAYRGRI
jgi:hypothetical protein